MHDNHRCIITSAREELKEQKTVTVEKILVDILTSIKSKDER